MQLEATNETDVPRASYRERGIAMGATLSERRVSRKKGKILVTLIPELLSSQGLKKWLGNQRTPKKSTHTGFFDRTDGNVHM